MIMINNTNILYKSFRGRTKIEKRSVHKPKYLKWRTSSTQSTPGTTFVYSVVQLQFIFSMLPPDFSNQPTKIERISSINIISIKKRISYKSNIIITRKKNKLKKKSLNNFHNLNNITILIIY